MSLEAVNVDGRGCSGVRSALRVVRSAVGPLWALPVALVTAHASSECLARSLAIADRCAALLMGPDLSCPQDTLTAQHRLVAC